MDSVTGGKVWMPTKHDLAPISDSRKALSEIFWFVGFVLFGLKMIYDFIVVPAELFSSVEDKEAFQVPLFDFTLTLLGAVAITLILLALLVRHNAFKKITATSVALVIMVSVLLLIGEKQFIDHRIDDSVSLWAETHYNVGFNEVTIPLTLSALKAAPDHTISSMTKTEDGELTQVTFKLMGGEIKASQRPASEAESIVVSAV